MSDITLQDLFLAIEQLAEDSTDLQDFKEGFEELVEETEYSLEEDHEDKKPSKLRNYGGKALMGLGALSAGSAAYTLGRFGHDTLKFRKSVKETGDATDGRWAGALDELKKSIKEGDKKEAERLYTFLHEESDRLLEKGVFSGSTHEAMMSVLSKLKRKIIKLR